MSLFIEHVLFGINALMPDFVDLVKKYTLLLAKVSEDVISRLPCLLLLILRIFVLRIRAESLSFVLFLYSVFSTVQT